MQNYLLLVAVLSSVCEAFQHFIWFLLSFIHWLNVSSLAEIVLFVKLWELALYITIKDDFNVREKRSFLVIISRHGRSWRERGKWVKLWAFNSVFVCSISLSKNITIKTFISTLLKWWLPQAITSDRYRFNNNRHLFTRELYSVHYVRWSLRHACSLSRLQRLYLTLKYCLIFEKKNRRELIIVVDASVKWHFIAKFNRSI